MSIASEEIESEQLTTANFGEVLLFAYGGFMRRHAANNGRAELLESYASELERQAVATQEDIQLPESGLPSPEILDQLITSVSGIDALRALARAVKTQHGNTLELDEGSIIGRRVTIAQIEGRPSNIISGGFRYKTEATGPIASLYLGPTASEIRLQHEGFGNRVWYAGTLVNPQDFSANYTLTFHPQVDDN